MMSNDAANSNNSNRAIAVAVDDGDDGGGGDDNMPLGGPGGGGREDDDDPHDGILDLHSPPPSPSASSWPTLVPRTYLLKPWVSPSGWTSSLPWRTLLLIFSSMAIRPSKGLLLMPSPSV